MLEKQDDIVVTLTTDKVAYKATEEIKVSVKVENTSGSAVSDTEN